MTCIRVSALSAFHLPGFLSTLSSTIVSGLDPVLARLLDVPTSYFLYSAYFGSARCNT